MQQSQGGCVVLLDGLVQVVSQMEVRLRAFGSVRRAREGIDLFAAGRRPVDSHHLVTGQRPDSPKAPAVPFECLRYSGIAAFADGANRLTSETARSSGLSNCSETASPLSRSHSCDSSGSQASARSTYEPPQTSTRLFLTPRASALAP